MAFHPNRKFRRHYARIFEENPEAANMYLLLCELADKKGRVKTDERELARLMAIRFADPRGFQL